MILKFDVYMHMLDTYRKIHMYLPDDYLTSNKKYPVLYMFDGHNLFYDEDATYGRSWRLIDAIQRNGKEIIVVGQECSHEGNDRLNEYSPYPFYDTHFGSFPGKGEATMNFLIEDLKLYIDLHFPTLSDRKHTWIGGSSCGGLMALYAVFKYSKVYSKAIVLSPYILPTLNMLMADINETYILHHTSIYLSLGAQEGDGMHEFVMETKGCTDLANLLLKKGVRIHFHVKPLGRHCEEDWEKESDQFLSFLMHES